MERRSSSTPKTWDDVERIRREEHVLNSKRLDTIRDSEHVAAELQRLTAESQRLRGKLDCLNQRLVEKRAEAEATHKSWFHSQCKRIKSNDPTFTTVDTKFFLHGYGKRIGEALQGNTRVSSLELSLDEIVTEDEEDESLDLLLHHIKTSPVMRSIGMDDSDFRWEREHGLRLTGLVLNAAAQNPYIVRLNGQSETPPDPFCHFLLQKSTTIKTVVLHNTIWDDVTEQQQSNMASALGNAHSLESLWMLFDNTAMNILLQMKEFAQNSSLRMLKLREFDEFQHDYDDDVVRWQSLEQFLGAAPMLEDLVLDKFDFDHQRMGPVIAALRQYGRSRTSTSSNVPPFTVTKAPFQLTLEDCTHQEDESIDSFVRFLREAPDHKSSGKRVNQEENETDVPPLPPNLELRLKRSSGSRHQEASMVEVAQRFVTSDDDDDDDDDVTLSTRNVGSPSVAVNGRLHTLSVNPNEADDFLASLTSANNSVSLQGLTLTALDTYQGSNLAASLSSWMSIRKLTIPLMPKRKRGMAGYFPNDCQRQILAGLQKNASLYRVDIRNTNGLSKAHLRRIDSFCQRNIFFDQQSRVASLRGNEELSISSLSSAIEDLTGPAMLLAAMQTCKLKASRVLGSLLKKGSDGPMEPTEDDSANEPRRKKQCL